MSQSTYESEKARAKANANRSRRPWALFCDTSGNWRAERWTGPGVAWAGVTRERIEPQATEKIPVAYPWFTR